MMIRRAIAAAAVAVAAALVSLINNQPVTTTQVEAPAIPVSVTSAPMPAEGDVDWSCREVTAHSNGVCGVDLPEGFTVVDIAECTTPELYLGCAAAVRERLGR